MKDLKMEGNYLFDRNGQPIHMIEWGAKLADSSYRIVSRTKLPCRRGTISTVWIGISMGCRPPQIFETAILGRKMDVLERYPTLRAARAGHRKWVEAMSSVTKPTRKK